jgi:transcriptional regulator with XRE-family HTH domain
VNRFGDKIRDRRRELGLTQQRLGELVGKSQVAVSEWERGVVRPKDPHSLAQALKMQAEELVMALRADFLEPDNVEAMIMEQVLLPLDIRQSLVTVYKAVLAGYLPASASSDGAKNVAPEGATLPAVTGVVCR